VTKGVPQKGKALRQWEKLIGPTPETKRMTRVFFDGPGPRARADTRAFRTKLPVGVQHEESGGKKGPKVRKKGGGEGS